MKNKRFEDYTEEELQEMGAVLISWGCFWKCNSLVGDLVKEGFKGFEFDNIINLVEPFIEGDRGKCPSCEKKDQILSYNEDEDGRRVCKGCFLGKVQEIYEWWVVDPEFADDLEKHGEPIIRNDYGCFWGRTCTGQSPSVDTVVQKIAIEIDNMRI